MRLFKSRVELHGEGCKKTSVELTVNWLAESGWCVRHVQHTHPSELKPYRLPRSLLLFSSHFESTEIGPFVVDCNLHISLVWRLHTRATFASHSSTTLGFQSLNPRSKPHEYVSRGCCLEYSNGVWKSVQPVPRASILSLLAA